MKTALIGRILLGALLILAAPSLARADSFTFNTLPTNGSISGAPGATVGWGYAITNQSATNWLVLTGLSADPFQLGTTNSSIFDFPIIAPLTTLTVSYVPINSLGLFEFTWDANAPLGFTNSGTFILSGEFWDADPLAGGNFVSFAADQTSNYSVTAAQTVTPVPEPSTWLLSVTGFMIAGFRRGHRKFQRQRP